MDSLMDTCLFGMWVSPFRYPRITGYLLLPAAFRSLSRLSSALSAKASALRPFLLNLFFFASPLYSVTRERLLLFLIVFLRCCAFRTALGCLFSLIDSFNIRFSRYGTGLSSCPVGLSGLEPPTSRLSGVRSNRLSYKPFFVSFSFPLTLLFFYRAFDDPMETKRFELSTPCLQGRCSPS